MIDAHRHGQLNQQDQRRRHSEKKRRGRQVLAKQDRAARRRAQDEDAEAAPVEPELVADQSDRREQEHRLRRERQ